jgi:hypothetical protein
MDLSYHVDLIIEHAGNPYSRTHTRFFTGTHHHSSGDRLAQARNQTQQFMGRLVSHHLISRAKVALIKNLYHSIYDSGRLISIDCLGKDNLDWTCGGKWVEITRG